MTAMQKGSRLAAFLLMVTAHTRSAMAAGATSVP
jgi:hypothetical protein